MDRRLALDQVITDEDRQTETKSIVVICVHCSDMCMALQGLLLTEREALEMDISSPD